MSEQQKTNFMAELRLWSDANIIGPLFVAARDYREEHHADWDKTVEQVQKALQSKVLESYRNGQAASKSAQPVRRNWRRP